LNFRDDFQFNYEIPISKSQIPNKFQHPIFEIPNSSLAQGGGGVQNLGHWNFENCLVLDIWDLTISPIFSFIWKGLIDQHDRDIIFDLVDETTRFADQAISRPV
jgi:hypothetical protein